MTEHDPTELDATTVSMELVDGYRFAVDFHQAGVPTLIVDEPQPLGEGQGPNAGRMLAAAVGDCLSASALFCLRKARVSVLGMRTSVQTTTCRNERGRLRVSSMRVRIHLEVPHSDLARVGRCLDLFEDYCVVSQSVVSGFEVDVAVEPTGVPAAGAAAAGGQ